MSLRGKSLADAIEIVDDEFEAPSNPSRQPRPKARSTAASRKKSLPGDGDEVVSLLDDEEDADAPNPRRTMVAHSKRARDDSTPNRAKDKSSVSNATGTVDSKGTVTQSVPVPSLPRSAAAIKPAILDHPFRSASHKLAQSAKEPLPKEEHVPIPSEPRTTNTKPTSPLQTIAKDRATTPTKSSPKATQPKAGPIVPDSKPTKPNPKIARKSCVPRGRNIPPTNANIPAREQAMPGAKVSESVKQPAPAEPVEKTLEPGGRSSDDISKERIEECLQKHLSELHENHAYSVKHILRRQRTSLERRAKQKNSIMKELVGTEDPFADMEPGRSCTFNSNAVNVPYYHEYVHLQNSVLSENNRKLLYYPYFADDQENDRSKDELWSELEDRFEMTMEFRATELLRDEQCRVHRFYVEAFLKEVGATWDAILFWFLALEERLKEILAHSKLASHVNDAEFKAFLVDRGLRYEKEEKELDRDEWKWQELLKRLPEPSPQELRLAVIVCKTFSEQRDFSIWHLARRSDTAQKYVMSIVPAAASPPKSDEFHYRDNTCMICHMWECPFHGEILEDPDRDSDQGNKPDNYDELDALCDSDIERGINFKRTVSIRGRRRRDIKENQRSLRQKFDVNYWLTKSSTAVLESRKPFYPCNHKGSCEQALCRCFREKILCEKFCNCSASCERRYPGCSCKDNCRAGEYPKCECRLLNRECDAELCGQCGAAAVLDPNNRYNEEVAKNQCCNVSIQRNVSKKTLLGNSLLHGFGLYSGEEIMPHDFLGEYKGEIITVDEGNRRGTIYEHQKTTYLFTLSQGQEIDSKRAGNKTRFVNHASGEDANCYAKTFLCNTVVRIGIFANQKIPPATELCFDYGYPKEKTKNFKNPSQTTAKAAIPTGSTTRQKNRSADKRAEDTRATRASRRRKESPPSTSSSSRIKARKSVLSRSRSRHLSRPRERDVDDEDDGSAAKASTSSSVLPSTQEIIPESDPEDDDFVEDDSSDDDEDDNESENNDSDGNRDEDDDTSSDDHSSTAGDASGPPTRRRNLRRRSLRSRRDAAGHGGARKHCVGRTGLPAREKRKRVVEDDDDDD